MLQVAEVNSIISSCNNFEMSNNRIKDRLRTILRQRGAGGIIGLQNTFREFDIDGNGQLSWEEFVL